MAGSISEFLSSFNRDPARSNRFEVYIPYFNTLNGRDASSLKSVYRCEIAQLPGRNFSTIEQKIYGPIEKFPYLSNYNDIDLTFIVDDDMKTKNAFDDWMEYINPTGNFNFNYKSDYAIDIEIRQYNLQNEISYKVKLIDSFPINMNQLDLDWSSDSIHKLTVTFAYTYWKSIPI